MAVNLRFFDRSHALRGNAVRGSLRLRRTQSVRVLYPRRAWAPSMPCPLGFAALNANLLRPATGNCREDAPHRFGEYLPLCERLFFRYFSPSTSCMSYRPAGFWSSHKAARTAPLAKVIRLEALWVISTRSPSAAKSTV